MISDLTLVALDFVPDYRNHRLRFGTPVARVTLDRRRAVAAFPPGVRLGYLRWEAGPYGTRHWSFAVLESAMPGNEITRVSGVRPGGVVLLAADGATRVRRALRWLDRLEAAGFDLAEVSTAYWQHLHNRLAVSRDPHGYALDQHRASTLRQALLRCA